MTDRPILFSAPMVRALLDGRKHQTRRVLKPQPNAVNGGLPLNNGRGSYSTEAGWKPYRFAKGDRLWVREAFSGPWGCRNMSPRDWPPGGVRIWHWADGNPSDGDWTKPKPGIHMPRWASRLTLTVTDVRVQRLQEISEADCIAEGIETVADNFGNGAAYRDYGLPDRADSAEWYRRPIDSFRSLWVKINGAASWVASPWIVALTFTVERRNIDA